MIPPDTQRAMSKRAGAKVVEVRGSHSVYVSQPGVVASLIEQAAQESASVPAPQDFYGANRPGSKVSQGLRDSFWLQSMMAGHKAVYDCVKAFSETDFTEDLKKIDVPTLILHGDDDQIVPIVASALQSSKIVKGATLKVIPGAPHGMVSTLKDQINQELLSFVEQTKEVAA
jgi:non-heme chloroperoxidase